MNFQTDAMKNENNSIWFLDIGCSNHICGRKEMFSELDEAFN